MIELVLAVLTSPIDDEYIYRKYNSTSIRRKIYAEDQQVDDAGHTSVYDMGPIRQVVTWEKGDDRRTS